MKIFLQTPKWISLPRNVILARLANYLSEMRNNDCSVPNQILVIPFQNGGNQNHIVHFGKLFSEHKGILVVKTTEGLKMFCTSFFENNFGLDVVVVFLQILMNFVNYLWRSWPEAYFVHHYVEGRKKVKKRQLTTSLMPRHSYIKISLHNSRPRFFHSREIIQSACSTNHIFFSRKIVIW